MSFSAWKNNIVSKVITLGIPYVVFTMITWGLKGILSGAVNNGNDPLINTLLLNPTAPYWYLYTLFFVYLITSALTSKKHALVGIIIAVALKYAQLGETLGINLFAITQTF